MTLTAVPKINTTRSRSLVESRLTSIDWNFSKRAKAPLIEAIHPYPAKFIGDIPRALLQSIPLPGGTVVFDPFVGSGTTLLEAQRFGVPSIGVDLNPIACLIARVKTAPTPVALPEAARRIVYLAKKRKVTSRSNIPNVNHWFKDGVQKAIAALLHEITSVSNVRLRDALLLALSSILVRVSNQDSDTRYAAIKKSVNGPDVFAGFIVAVDKLTKALLARSWSLPSARVIEANTLTLNSSLLRARVGLVITSPPYPNAYEYWLYHKYRMWWLGFDPLAVKEHEIGARAHFFGRLRHTEQHFWEQMRGTFALLGSVVVSKGYACFVIGRSRIHGKIVENSDIIAAVGAEHGFETISRFDRLIAASRKSFNLSHANIKSETVLVLQRARV